MQLKGRNFLKLMDYTPEAVSYTHLDVYKRQIQQIVGRHNRVVNQASPIVDTRLSDGSRVNIVLNPISIGGSALSIRKFPEHPMSLSLIHI